MRLGKEWEDETHIPGYQQFNARLDGGRLHPRPLRLGCQNLGGFWAQTAEVRTLRKEHVLHAFVAGKVDIFVIQEGHIQKADWVWVVRWCMGNKLCLFSEHGKTLNLLHKLREVAASATEQEPDAPSRQ